MRCMEPAEKDKNRQSVKGRDTGMGRMSRLCLALPERISKVYGILPVRRVRI